MGHFTGQRFDGHPAGAQHQHGDGDQLQESNDHAGEDIESRAANHQCDRVDQNDRQDRPERRVILRAILDKAGDDQAGEKE